MSSGRQHATQHLRKLLQDEVRLKKEQGYNGLDGFNEKINGADFFELHRLEEQLETLPEPDGLKEREPLDWVIPNPGVSPWNPSEAELQDRITGAWYGRIAGCILGKPVECHEFFARPKSLRAFLEATNQWPLTDFVIHDDESMQKFAGHVCYFVPSTKGNIRYAQSDDDLRYTLAGLRMLEKNSSVTPQRVYNYWAAHWLMNHTFTAEQATISNAYAFGKPQGWLHDHATDEAMAAMRQWRNPYREWIGAAIRADGWGYGFAGDPYRAACAAQQDAKLTHERNGEYSEIFFAAWISGAFRFSLHESFDIALGLIPPQSRLAITARETKAFCESNPTFDQLLDFIADKTGHYNGVHAINNAAACVGAVFLSGGDFEKGITQAVMCALDTDCNGATVGSILGANIGAANFPVEKWVKPFNDTIDFEYVGEERRSITEVARWTAELWTKLNRK